MTSLAYRHCGRRRGGGGVRGSRPLLCREVSRCGPHLFLGEVYRDLLHGVAGAISVLEFTQLLQDIIFLQTPDDRNTLQFGRAVHTVAYPTNHQLAADDGLRFSGISRSCRNGQRGENAEQAANRRNAIVRHDTVPARVSEVRASKAPTSKHAALGRGTQDRPILVNYAPSPAPL